MYVGKALFFGSDRRVNVHVQAYFHRVKCIWIRVHFRIRGWLLQATRTRGSRETTRSQRLHTHATISATRSVKPSFAPRRMT